MLNIVIELHPFGDASKKRVIGGLQIANDGTGNSKIGHYLYRKDPSEDWRPSIREYNRDQDAEYLLYQVLKYKYDQPTRHQ